MRAADLNAIVTGGASGLGLATAAAVVDAGGRAVLLDVDATAGEAAVARLTANRPVGPAALFEPCDVTDEGSVERAMGAAAARLGQVNLLVCCAGIIGAGRLLGREGPLPAERFARTIAVNLTGTFLCMRAAATLMQHNAPGADGERGLLLATASAAAFEGQVGQVAYSASKAGIVGMTLPLARELAAFGIRCMTIAPGAFDTPMAQALPPETRAGLAAQVPFPKRLGEPAEFARLVIAVAENPMLNGTTLRIDGALRLPPR